MADEFAVRLNRRMGSKIRPREISTGYSYYGQYLPSGSIPSPGGQLTFQVPAQTGRFIDLKSSFIEVNGILTNLSQTDSSFGMPQETVKNGFGDLLWSTVQAQIGTTSLTDNSQTFNFIPSFIRRCLEKPAGWNGSSSVQTVSSGGYAGGIIGGAGTTVIGPATLVTFSTSAGAGDSMGYNLCQGKTPLTQSGGARTNCENTVVPAINPGVLTRLMRTCDEIYTTTPGTAAVTSAAAARPFTFLSWPCSAFNSMDMLLPDGIGVNLLLTRSRDSLVISSSNGSSTTGLTIQSCRLWIRFVQPTPIALQEFNAAIIERPISLPYIRANSALVNISSASSQINASGLCAGLRPDIVTVSFHYANAVNGSYGNSPFAMRPAAFPSSPAPYITQLAQIYVTWGGMNYPLLPIVPDADGVDAANVQMGQNDARAYLNYCAVADHGLASDSSPLLSYEMFTSNYGFYVFDLRPAASYESGAIGSVKTDDETSVGSLQVVGNFVAPVNGDLICCVNSFGGGQLVVDSSRNVIRTGF